MNDNEKVLAALGNGDAAKSIGDGKESSLEGQLEKAQHTSDVWAGRAKRLAAEKAKIEAEKAEVEEELRRLKSGSAAEAAVEKLTPEQLGDTPKEFAKAAVTAAAQLVSGAEGKHNEEMAKLRAEIAEKERKAFVDQIGMANPKFFNDVAVGGDKQAMWEQFKLSNRETFAAIMESNDTSRFNRFVGQFYREIGVPNPSGSQGGSAVPEPRTTVGGPQGGGAVVEDGKKYTTDEYLKLLDEAEEDFRVNKDLKAYQAKTSALNKALNEGRVG